MHEAVRELEPPDAAACDAIVAGLPEWFGNEQGIRDCALAVRWHVGIVATDEAGVNGFLTWTEHRERGVAEITWMAVRATSGQRVRVVAELDIWDEDDPAVLLSRSL